MERLVLDLCMLSLTLCVCTNSEIFMRTIKRNKANSMEEGYRVFVSRMTVVTSVTPIDFVTQINEYCAENYNYGGFNLELTDSGSNKWNPGSSLEIQGEYGNTIYKGYMHENDRDALFLTFLYPIRKMSSWRFISGTTTNKWADPKFDDSEWLLWTSNMATTTTGTQYFRKQVSASSSPAAYEIQIKYKYGVVFYIDGNEILRDNMPNGEITSVTSATGEYSTLTYHGYIRNGYEISYNMVVGFEIHFPTNVTQTYIDFDAWMSTYSPSTYDNSCYIIPETPVISSLSGVDVSKAQDWDFSTYYSAVDVPKAELNLMYESGIRYQITGLVVYPGGDIESSPTSFSFSGVNGTVIDSFLNADSVIYTANTNYYAFASFNLKQYSSFKFSMTASQTGSYSLYELYPSVCSVSIPSVLTYDVISVSLYKNYQEMVSKPTFSGFHSCTISPQLPAGINISFNTCIISGVPTTIKESIVYTVTSVAGVGYTSLVTIEVRSCDQSLIKIARKYQGSSRQEGMRIENQDGLVIYSVAMNSGQPSYKEVNDVVCVPSGRYKLTMECSTTNWSSMSFVNIFNVIDDDDSEQVLRARYDANLNLPNTYYFNAGFTVKGRESWWYKTGEVPASWTDSGVTGWTESLFGSFPSSSNQIQLYKKIFNVASLSHASGFTLGIRYKYGCIVYVNGYEIFRNRITGDLSSSTMAVGAYSDVTYRFVSLPVVTMVTSSESSVHILHEGVNVVSIAIIASDAQQTESYFDCTLNILGDDVTSRVFDYVAKTTGTNGGAESPWNDSFNSNIYAVSSCTAENTMTIVFNNDRREWIASYSITNLYNSMKNNPTSFSLEARNTEEEEWTVLDSEWNWKWWGMSQEKRTFLPNNKPYNQFRFHNVRKDDPTSCIWKINRLALYIELTNRVVPDLQYESTSGYRDIEFAEVYPNSIYYSDFSVTPALPRGMEIDPPSGVIMGTPQEITGDRKYVVNATRYNGASASTALNLTITICTGGKSLITLAIRTDSNPQQMGFTVFKGRGLDGEVYRTKQGLPAGSTMFYSDMCADHGIYTLIANDTNSNGWSTPAGYMLTVDMGTLKLDLDQNPVHSPAPSSVTTVFSSFIPFQKEHDLWLVHKAAVQDSWTDKSFDDSTWTELKALAIGTNSAATTYIRKAFDLPNMEDYNVLNVRLQYVGGVAVYFNGQIAARFNLPETWDAETEVEIAHDLESWSRFNVILSTTGAVVGKNVIAFEVHRVKGSSDVVAFEATGVFGVNDCSLVSNSLLRLNGTSPYSGVLTNIFDNDVTTTASLRNNIGTFMEWEFENREAVRFNSVGIQPGNDFSSFGFSLYGRDIEEESWMAMMEVRNQKFVSRTRQIIASPGSIVGVHNYRLEIDDTASSTPQIYEMLFMYCKATGAVCAAVGDFPSVAEGQISPALCPYGFTGYQYRECHDGMLGDVYMDKCRNKAPLNMHYISTKYVFVMETEIISDAPNYVNIIDRFFVAEMTFLPSGLFVNETTGAIQGRPTKVAELHEYTIIGKNSRGAVSTSVFIQVREGECKTDGVYFPTTRVGIMVEIDCSVRGNYVGTQKRACKLGRVDGEWQKTSGICFSVGLLVAIIVIGFLILLVIIVVVVRTMRQAKVTGGVKGKKNRIVAVKKDDTKMPKV